MQSSRKYKPRSRSIRPFAGQSPTGPCEGCSYKAPQICKQCQEKRHGETGATEGVQVLPTVPKANKYKAKRTEYNGREYASGREAKRASELWPLFWAGAIVGLREQVNFPVEINGQHIMNYRADFLYLLPDDPGAGTQIEDSKGYKTPMYRMKKKMVEAYYGCTIIET